MSDTENLVAEYEINNIELEAEYDLSENQHIDADFVINAAPEKVSQLENDLNYQTQEQVQEAIQSESDVINARIDSEVERLEDEIADATLDIQGSDLIGVSQNEQTVTITSKTFVFEQGIPAKDWVVVHNLGKRPSITTTYTNGQEFKSYREYTNNNQVIIRLNNAATGFVYLN